jgi:hypothetical protein
MEIRALKVLRGLSETERLEKGAAIIDALRPWAIIAAGIVGAQETIVPHVERYLDEYSGNILNQLTKATHDAKTFVDIIHAAECRVAAALASIEDGRTS